MSATQPAWKLTGEYFENCSCDLLCPCEVNPLGVMAGDPSRGYCEAPIAFHIERGAYGDVTLDGLNAVVALRTPGPMGAGNASVALYIDDRASEQQAAALGAIFGGQAGGPMGALAPLVTTFLGVKKVPITYVTDGKCRSVEIPDIMSLSIQAVPNLGTDREIVLEMAHPFADRLVIATGDPGSVYHDHGMVWDNSGRNGHYAAITWSNG